MEDIQEILLPPRIIETVTDDPSNIDFIHKPDQLREGDIILKVEVVPLKNGQLRIEYSLCRFVIPTSLRDIYFGKDYSSGYLTFQLLYETQYIYPGPPPTGVWHMDSTRGYNPRRMLHTSDITFEIPSSLPHVKQLYLFRINSYDPQTRISERIFPGHSVELNRSKKRKRDSVGGTRRGGRRGRRGSRRR